jgi:hypothetical protein
MVGGRQSAMMDHARRTADNTTRLVTGVLQIAGLVSGGLIRAQSNDVLWAD